MNNQTSLIIKNISWLNSFKAANYLNSLVIGSWIIRSFNPSEIGMYGYANSVTEILACLAGLGITQPLLKDFSSDKPITRKLLTTTSLIYFISSTILYACLLIFAARRPELEIKILLSVLGLKVLLKFTDIYETWYLSKTQSKEFVSAQIIALLTSSSIKTVAIYTDQSIVIIAIADIASILALALTLELKTGIIRSTFKEKFNITLNIKSILHLAKRGLPFMISSTLIALNLQIDMLLVKHFLGLTGAGIYVAALKIPTIIPGILYSIEQTMAPINLKHIEQGTDSLSTFKKTYSPIIYASLLLTVLTCVLSNKIIAELFGPTYREAAPAMAVLSSTILLGSIANLQAQYCLLNEKSKDIFKTSLLIFLFNLILDILLIRSFGLTGAAIGSSTAVALALLAYKNTDKEFSKLITEIFKKPDFSYLSTLSLKAIIGSKK